MRELNPSVLAQNLSPPAAVMDSGSIFFLSGVRTTCKGGSFTDVPLTNGTLECKMEVSSPTCKVCVLKAGAEHIAACGFDDGEDGPTSWARTQKGSCKRQGLRMAFDAMRTVSSGIRSGFIRSRDVCT